jgi:photoactive yellow protein
MNFTDTDLLEQLEATPHAALDDQTFGIIVMSGDGKVEAYNAFESSAAGLEASRVIGLNFFSDVAPCTNNYLVAGRYEEAAELDETVPYVFTLRMKPTRVRLRLLKSARARFSYLLVAWA